jgi:hypothetical protein
MCRLVANNRTFILKLYVHLIGPAIAGWLCLNIIFSETCLSLGLRQVQNNYLTQTRRAISNDAVQVFVYAGEPRAIKVNDNNIAVDYGRCGIVFNRSNGEVIERFDVEDGWPKIRPNIFPKIDSSHIDSRFIGPGIFDKIYKIGSKKKKIKFEETCSVEFEGRTWRAYQPADFRRNIQKKGYDNRTGPYSTWSGILARLNAESYLQADAPEQKSRRYKMSDGLASNIVTRLIPSQGYLWAVCVDIYEPEKDRWGPGGLSRFDLKTNRWEHVKTINGYSIRWVTLMETIGDDLWIGFREGNGIEGDKINYGMGVSAGIYRPKTSAILLARFAKDKWTVFLKPLPLVKGSLHKENSPTEMPLQLAGSSKRVFLCSGYNSRRPAFNFEYQLDGCISSLDLHTYTWRSFDLYKDFDADRLVDMLSENGEILIRSNRGAHRWDDKSQSWKLLDPQTELKNPSLSTAAQRNNELWIGYTNQSFGVIGQQGISVYDEETLKWSYFSQEQIGTGCPVRRMGADTNGYVWILFGRRPNRGALAEFLFYPREAKFFHESGLGCFRRGKWEFPIELTELDFRNDFLMNSTHDLVTIGDKLFVAGKEGVYLGPDKWRRIIEGDILRIEPSSDKKSLIILRQGPRSDQDFSTFQRGRYDLTTGDISFESLPYKGLDRMQLEPPTYLWNNKSMEPETSKAWRKNWVLSPGYKEGNWVVGPMGSNDYHGVIETPSAFWIASRGELVRLDIKNIVK